MLEIALGIFAVAAAGGAFLASHVLKGRFAPWAVSILHGLLGATGVVLLLLAVLRGAAGGLAPWALGAFVLAAMGGLFLASLHARQVLPPKPVVLVHGGVALTGFVLLLLAFL